MITTFTGSNHYMLATELRALTRQLEATYGDMALERLDGEEASVERLSEALTSVPFLADKKVVLIRNASINKQFVEKADDLLSNVPETTDVVLVESKLDKRSSYYKFLKKSTDYREYTELDPHALAKWLVQLAKERHGTLSVADAAFLVQRVGTNQQILANELEKLLLYNDKISRDSIEKLTESTPQSTIFELLESSFAGNTKRALDLYAEQRALKVEPQQIIAMLAWQLHILALIKTGGDRSPETIASQSKVSPYVIKKSISIARRLSLVDLRQLIADLAVIDGRSKRETFNIDDALRYFLLSIGNGVGA